MSNEMIKRHLGRPTEIELESIDGETDKFCLSPLPVSKVPELYETLSITKGAKPDDASAMFSNITPQWIDKVVALGLLALKPNYPDIDDELLKELVARNAIVIASELWMANLGLGNKNEIGNVKRQRILEEIRSKQQGKA